MLKLRLAPDRMTRRAECRKIFEGGEKGRPRLRYTSGTPIKF